jgi:hypothetical protein
MKMICAAAMALALPLLAEAPVAGGAAAVSEAAATPSPAAASVTPPPAQTPAPELGMKGAYGLGFGAANGLPSVTGTWFQSDRDSLRLLVGGNGSEAGAANNEPDGADEPIGPSFNAFVELGERHSISPLWGVAVPYVQASLGVKGSETSSLANWGTSGSDWWEQIRHQQEVDGTLRLGVGSEFFWPGRRDFSLEAGISALFYVGQQRVAYDYFASNMSAFSGFGNNGWSGTTWVGGVATDQTNLLAKANVYFR